MNCAEARDAMLTANLDELRPGTSALGVHLDACASCRQLADGIVADTARVAVLLAGDEPRRRRAARRRVAVALTIPIAAAVLVAISIATRRSDDTRAQPPARPVERHVSLTVAPGQQATVIKTADPNVTVIWLSQGGGQ